MPDGWSNSRPMQPSNPRLGLLPFDPESPFVTSGLRLGSAALTTRGFDEQAFEDVGNIIADRLLNPNDEKIKEESIKKVSELCNKFPLYSEKI